jgi:hypothetical protein
VRGKSLSVQSNATTENSVSSAYPESGDTAKKPGDGAPLVAISTRAKLVDVVVTYDSVNT